MYLIKEDLWEVINSQPMDMDDPPEIVLKRTKALSAIVLAVDNDQLVLLRNANSGGEAWNILREYHQQNTTSSQLRSMKALFQMRLGKGTDMQKHIQTIFEMIGELQDKGMHIDDRVLVSFLLASLNEEYDALVTAIEAWSEDRLTSAIVKAKLLEEWRKKSSQQANAREQACTSGQENVTAWHPVKKSKKPRNKHQRK